MDPKLIERLKTQYTVHRPSIRFEEYLGDGSFSVAFSAFDGPVPCAVKFSKRPWQIDGGAAKERKALLDLLVACNGHPHVASLHYYTELGGHLATQWERGGECLERYLKACQERGLRGIPRSELLMFMQQAAEGIDFLNQAKEIVHRDIKPENLLLFQNQVKLVDLGFARLSESNSVTNSVFGTPAFAPPEANTGRLHPNVDIYCLARSRVFRFRKIGRTHSYR